MKTKPEWFKPLCIMALVLGVIGMCCDVIGSGASLFNPMAAGLNAEQQAIVAQSLRFRPFTLGLAALSIVQCAVLSVGAGLCLKEPLRYGRILRAGLLAGLVLVPIGMVLGLVIQFSQRGLYTSTPLGEGFGTAIMSIGWVFGIGWALLKMGFFYVTLKTLDSQGAAPV